MYVACPKCEAEYQIADNNEGKSLKCSNCQAIFRARLNRAAIKSHSMKEKLQEGKWPTKVPTLAPTRNMRPLINAALAMVGILAVVGFVVAMVYVYKANSDTNKQLLEQNASPQTELLEN